MTTLNQHLFAVLKSARELLADPKRWTKGTYARDELGWPVGPASTSAVCYCSVGAIHRARRQYPEGSLFLEDEAILTLGGRLGLYNVATWNDAVTTSHADVIAGFDRAINDLVAKT